MVTDHNNYHFKSISIKSSRLKAFSILNIKNTLKASPAGNSILLSRLILTSPIREKAQQHGKPKLASKKKPLSPSGRNEWLTDS